MSMTPHSQDDDIAQDADRQDADRQADAQADAMKAQLRKDVASWSKARGETSQQLVAVPSAPPARQPSVQSVAKSKKSKAAATAAQPPPPGAKPFSMSYDGGTTADYIQYMIDRGAR